MIITENNMNNEDNKPGFAGAYTTKKSHSLIGLPSEIFCGLLLVEISYTCRLLWSTI